MKFSIVTPVFNGEKFIEETIKSVISQAGNFSIEYIICDGGSTDGTIEILKKYETWLAEKNSIKCQEIKFIWFSQKDNGMYDAINKGFGIATGDIYAWLNSDDLYQPGAFEIVSKTFQTFPQIKWLKGITSFIDENSKICRAGICLLYNQEWITQGIYGRNAYFIHQDSVFWKSELWKKAGPIDNSLRFAGDYFLWTKFSKFENLWSIKAGLSFFRKRKDQMSANMDKYRAEQNLISPPKGWLMIKVKIFFWLKSKFNSEKIHPLFLIFYKIIFRNKNSYYVDIDSGSNIIIKRAYSYIA